PPGGAGSGLGTVTKTLLQNMQVLSAGQDMQKDAEGKPVSVPVVNLLVTPDQAETLSLASNEMHIQLVLRNPLDTQKVTTPGTAVSNLFTGDTGVALQPRPAPKPAVKTAAKAPLAKPVVPQVDPPKPVVPLTVEVITGTTRAETKFKPDEGKQ
ncbi:MAG TPA: RcpC/CpaB family pilus assembly protein, partial [Bryobacteraceae bacterium]|nr:RcpC/CpaB family pilus assembly protein [Bryobacteraceae bacterium]